MAHLLANVGGMMLPAASDQNHVRVHAVMRQDGKVGVMLINTDPAAANTVTVTFSGAIPASTGKRYQFGLTNFTGNNDFLSYPVATSSISGLGNQFTASVPPYTIINLIIPLQTKTPPVLAVIANQT